MVSCILYSFIITMLCFSLVCTCQNRNIINICQMFSLACCICRKKTIFAMGYFQNSWVGPQLCHYIVMVDNRFCSSGSKHFFGYEHVLEYFTCYFLLFHAWCRCSCCLPISSPLFASLTSNSFPSFSHPRFLAFFSSGMHFFMVFLSFLYCIFSVQELGFTGHLSWCYS